MIAMGVIQDLRCDAARDGVIRLDAGAGHRDLGGADREQAADPDIRFKTTDNFDVGSEDIRDRLAILILCQPPRFGKTAAGRGLTGLAATRQNENASNAEGAQAANKPTRARRAQHHHPSLFNQPVALLSAAWGGFAAATWAFGAS